MSDDKPMNSDRKSCPARFPTQRVSTWRVRARPETIVGQISDSWRYRGLLRFFFVNATLSAYSGALLGWGWLIIRPFVMATIAMVVIRDMLGVSTDPVPFLLFVLYSFGLWIFFQRGMAWGTRSFQQHKRLMTRFSFPPLLLHACALGPGLAESAVVITVSTVATVVVALVFDDFAIALGWNLFAVPAAFLLTALLVLGITSMTTVLNNMARDVWYTLRFVIMAWTVVTPIYYPRSAVPAPYRDYMLYNPMTPIVELYRWGLFRADPVPWSALMGSCGVIALLLLVGFWVFAKLERRSLGIS